MTAGTDPRMFTIAVLVGAALALPFVAYANRTGKANRVFGIGLILGALIYVGFAVVRGTSQDVLLELGGVALFAAIALAGIRFSSALIAFGWAAHVSWDVLLHPSGYASYSPWWHPLVCVGFDLIVAGAILGAWTNRPRATP
jgi:hypothetical protein